MSYTGNPRHPNNPPSDYPSEPTGAVAKDSLASESIASGGGFADNDNAQAMGVKGYQSTLATEDTSNADVLRPAPSGAAREQGDLRGLGADERGDLPGTVRYPDADAGKGYDGTFSDQGYRGGSGDPSVSSSGGNTYSSGGGGGDYDSSNISSSGTAAGSRPYVEKAPNYTADFTSPGELRPKGDNLVEGDVPETKTFTGDVGGPNDPGRLAERQFQKMDADSSAGIGNRGYGDADDQDNTYDNLNRSERA